MSTSSNSNHTKAGDSKSASHRGHADLHSLQAREFAQAAQGHAEGAAKELLSAKKAEIQATALLNGGKNPDPASAEILKAQAAAKCADQLKVGVLTPRNHFVDSLRRVWSMLLVKLEASRPGPVAKLPWHVCCVFRLMRWLSCSAGMSSSCT